jgi:uncharacterized protein (TIGR04141 family)
MARSPKSQSLSIFLVKKELSRPEDILSHFANLHLLDVAATGRRLGTLFVKGSKAAPPSWLSFFEKTINLRSLKLENSSTSAVLLLKAGERTFALTFGYGSTLLRDGAYEEDFGLKTTLNSVDPARIRSVDRITFDAISRHSRIQASQDATIGLFGLDIEQDLVRAVTGQSGDSSLGTRLTGRDGLQVQVKVRIAQLPDLLEKYLRAYRQTTYRDHFPWIDLVREVRDPQRLEKLDDRLLQAIKHREFSRLWLTVPQIIEWERVQGFRYRPSYARGTFDDIHIKTFLDVVKDLDSLNSEALKHEYQVRAIDAGTDTVFRHWSVYKCLYFETDIGQDTFLLNGGKWYRVDGNFLKRVNRSFDRIPKNKLMLPDYNDQSEEAYNRRVAHDDARRFALMDRKLISFEGIPDTIEFCDLFSRDKEIIHVKRYGGSSTLSHLFLQGLVSGQLFAREESFREKVRKKLPASHRSQATTAKPGQDEYDVVFAIISKSSRPLKIPFFSRVSLRNAYQRLTELGYGVSLTLPRYTRGN